MRRLTSTLIAAATALGSVAIAASPVSAGTPGSVTETAVTGTVPTSPANLQMVRLVRLSRTGEFLAIGKPTGSGQNYYMWQLKSDYTVDTSFGTNGVIDTGVADPASCSTQNMNNTGMICSSVRGLAYNEVSNTYALVINRQIGGTSYIHALNHIIVGDLKTGQIKSTAVTRDVTSTSSTNADTEFAGLGITAQTLSKEECTAVAGTSVNGTVLTYAFLETYSSYMLPNGSLVLSLSCNYSNTVNNTAPVTDAKEYRTSHYLALKVSGSSLVLDTAWGTNGRVIVNAADSGKCVDNYGMSPVTDLGITTMTSTKPYTVFPVSVRNRSTTVPSGMNYTTYEGCNTVGQSIQYTSKLYTITAAGKVTEALDMGTSTTPMFPTRWVIDPAGRWVSIIRSSTSPSSQTPPTYSAVRLVNGKGDTTFGTNGQKALDLPSTVTVNGASVSVNYSISGMITTQDEVLFTGLSSTSNPSMIMCNQAGTVTQTLQPFVLSLKTGTIDTTYGTGGLGAAATVLSDQMTFCGSSSAGATFVTSKGQPAYLRSRSATGSQTAGTFIYLWDTVTNATGGGDGGTGTGGATKDTGGAAFTGEKPFSAALAAAPTTGGSLTVAGRVDAKVYTKAPARVETNSAITVLKASDADDLDIVTSTPKVCIALTTSVVFTGTGRCTVRIVDEDTRRVVRSFSTTVSAAESTAGTALTTDKPIMFGQVQTALSATARAQVKELAAAATGAGRILILGHSASLYGNEVSNRFISLQRAAAVKRALIAAGVKNPISIVAMGSKDMVSTGKTEAQQALNRRVEVFIFPVAN